MDVTAAAMKPWALLMRDANPLHLEPAVVSNLGLGERVVNQGPLNQAYLWELLDRWLGDTARVRRLQTRFTGNAFDGDHLVAGGRVASIDATAGTATCVLWLRRGTDDIARGTATLSQEG